MVLPLKKDLQQNSKLACEQQPFNLLLRSYLRTYCSKSTIHGVKYLCDNSLHYAERLLWVLLVGTSLIFACFAYILLMRRHGEHRLQTIVENPQYPVFEIPFPAVAVCTDNRINWQKFEEAKQLFLPPNADKATVDVFTTFVERMETLSFGYFSNFNEMDDLNLNALSDIGITKLADFLALKCEDVFHKNSCVWRRKKFDCCEGFILEHTEWGMCLVFNSLLSENSRKLQANKTKQFYPRHNSKAGQSTGLNFRLELNTKFQRPNATLTDTVKIMVKPPNRLSSSAYTITPNTESYIVVRPEITDTDESTRNLSPSERNCRFLDEQDAENYYDYAEYKIYRHYNCISACREEHIIKYCNCTLPLFFPIHRNVSICKAADFKCLAKNNDIFTYNKRKGEDEFFNSAKPGMLCECFIGCKNTEYFTTLTTLPLVMDDIPNDNNSVIFRVDVHYQAEVLVKYRTSLEFTTLDLIANFGGIFGLCLGASMVSAVELLYYMTFGFILFLYDNNFHRRIQNKMKQQWRVFKNNVSETEKSEVAKQNFGKYRKSTKDCWQ